MEMQTTRQQGKRQPGNPYGVTTNKFWNFIPAAGDKPLELLLYGAISSQQSWWEDKATLYTQDQDGAYFIYNSVCSEEDYAKLVPGTKIKVTGYKTEWSGEVEIAEGATFEIEEGSYIAPVTDVTVQLGRVRRRR